MRSRALNRCEYCQLPANAHPAPFQLDHIVARQHGGTSTQENLALACMHCNRHKGPNIAGIDPATNALERLFHPRLDSWDVHFVRSGPVIIGLSAIGRTTVRVLHMNADELLELREALLQERP